MTGNSASSHTENWDAVITPESGYLDVDVKELWRYRDLVRMFVKKDIITVYKQTILGPVWFIAQPLFTSFIFLVIFTKVAGISTDGIPPMPFYLIGNTLWNYFSETLGINSKTFIDNANIFGKVYFPRLALPISKAISGLVKFAIQFALFLMVWGYELMYKHSFMPGISILLAPVWLLCIAMISLGFGLLVSALTTRYRDLQFLVSFAIMLAMYVTPVIYPVSVLHGKMHMVMLLNPLSPLFEAFKYGFFGKGFFDWGWIAYSVAFTVVIFLLGVLTFNKVEKRFIDTV
jgi:lipopolysaccharide transport system permease protein